MSEFTRQPMDTGFSGVPHGFWTIDVSPGARVLLGWLHSHTDAYLATVTQNRARRELRTSSVTRWLAELEAAGFVEIQQSRPKMLVTLLAEPWQALFGPRPNGRANRADMGAPTAPVSARVGEQREEQEKNTSCASTPSSADELFEKFYAKYPRKRAPQAARKAFKAALKRDGIDAISSGFKRLLPELLERPEHLRPYPATWLNSADYLSQPSTPTTVTEDGTHKDAGKIFFNGDNTRYMVNADGSRTQLGPEDD